MSNEPDMSKFTDDVIRLSMGRPSSIELVEDNDDAETYKIKFELMDVGTYNMFNFSEENLDFMVKEFHQDKNGVVSHGLDHSWKTREQIGLVYDLVKEGKGKSSKVFAFSELHKSTSQNPDVTEAQREAHILFKQGLLKFVSGGWFPTKYKWNEETGTIDIENPKLREISSTPMPAKQDAKQKEILQSLNHSPIDNMEDKIMSNENPEKPSPEGKEVSEQVAKLTALENEYKAGIAAMNAERTAMKAKTDADVRTGLIGRAKELGLSEEVFKDASNDAIEVSLKAAKEMQVKLLREREPVAQFGGEGNAGFVDGSPEMIDFVAKEFYGFVERKV
jgi:hypothetical protein